MAKTKKKTDHTNTITPPLTSEVEVLFDNLKQGEAFLMNGSLYIKESGGEQIGVNLATGKYNDGLCGVEVEPVDITITWKRK